MSFLRSTLRLKSELALEWSEKSNGCDRSSSNCRLSPSAPNPVGVQNNSILYGPASIKRADKFPWATLLRLWTKQAQIAESQEV